MSCTLDIIVMIIVVVMIAFGKFDDADASRFFIKLITYKRNTKRNIEIFKGLVKPLINFPSKYEVRRQSLFLFYGSGHQLKTLVDPYQYCGLRYFLLFYLLVFSVSLYKRKSETLVFPRCYIVLLLQIGDTDL